MKLKVKEQIKTLLAQENIKLKELAQMIAEKNGKKCTPNSLTQKLIRETFTYNEVLMISEILGYDIIFVKKEH